MLNGAMIAELRERVCAILAPANLLASPVLCSCLSSKDAIPISCLMSDLGIVRLGATATDIVIALQGTAYECFKDIYGVVYVTVPYRVWRKILVVRQMVGFARTEELEHYVKCLNGRDTRCSVYRTKSGDFLIHFEDKQVAIACWRAMRTVPFKGRFLETEMAFTNEFTEYDLRHITGKREFRDSKVYWKNRVPKKQSILVEKVAQSKLVFVKGGKSLEDVRVLAAD